MLTTSYRHMKPVAFSVAAKRTTLEDGTNHDIMVGIMGGFAITADEEKYIQTHLKRRSRVRNRKPATHVYSCCSSRSLVIICFLLLLSGWACFVITFDVQSSSSATRQKPPTVPPLIVVHHSMSAKDLLQHSGRQQALHNNHNVTAFCTSWSVNVDMWWQKSVIWEAAVMNITHQCFARITQPAKRRIWEQLYHIQFPAPTCNNAVVVKKYMTGSGWGIDFSHVVDGFRRALEEQVTVDVVAPRPWQYAQSREVQACATTDPQCYFLPWSNCTDTMMRHKGPPEKPRFHIPWRGFLPKASDDAERMTNAWILQYATRAQTWLRWEAVHLASKVRLQQPCVAMHVRRADVVLHGNFSRRYHPISEYINALQKKYDTATLNLLLLTDDSNAITEALSQHSGWNWFYLNRPRHRGAEGGWENQIPSNDPRSEVISLHAMFRLVSQCHTLVHSKSNLADYLFAVMQLQNADSKRISLDDGKVHQEIHRAKNSRSVKISTRFEPKRNELSPPS